MKIAGRTVTKLRGLLARWEVFLIFVLVGTFICGAQVSRYFLTSSNISIALAGMTPAAIVALPMTLIIVTGEIDISVGSIVGLCASLMAVCLEHKLPVGVAMLLGVLVGTLAGFVNGLIVVYAALPSLVVTIGTLALYRGIAQIILQERGMSGFPEWYQNLGFGTIGATPIPWSSVIFVLFLIGFAIFLHTTHWGRALYAIGNNLGAARFSGINVKRALLGVFVASGAMSSRRCAWGREHLWRGRYDGRRSDRAPGAGFRPERAGPRPRDTGGTTNSHGCRADRDVDRLWRI
jgi:rhamnose transport system permease protein